MHPCYGINWSIYYYFTLRNQSNIIKILNCKAFEFIKESFKGEGEFRSTAIVIIIVVVIVIVIIIFINIIIIIIIIIIINIINIRSTNNESEMS